MLGRQLALACSQFAAFWNVAAVRRQDGTNALAGYGPPPPVQLGNVQWLHIPKTGTSLIATIWTYACSRDRVLDLKVDPNATPYCGRCYDFALMDRYPRDEYCKEGALYENFATQHMPMNVEMVASEAVNYVSFFRKPSQRIYSAMLDGYHTNGFGKDTRRELYQQCDPRNGTRAQHAACFARFPGIAGCATRMLTGLPCAFDCMRASAGGGGSCEDAAADLKNRVELAITNLEKLAFVGITEEWNESICLFHLMFGGRLHQDEFKNVHHGRAFDDSAGTGDEYDAADLDGFVDEADEVVYMAAKARFDKLRATYTDGSSSACALINGASESAGLPSTDCKGLGIQCGEVAGDVAADCGECPALKLKFTDQYSKSDSRFLSQVRPSCNQGQCVVSVDIASLFDW